jgi:hypothetical protein
VRTFADWSEPSPGFLEVDFVSRGGDSMKGTFLWSLLATDVCSGWTEAVALVAREKSLIVEGLEVTRRHLPVPVLGIDSDNDSAFINETLQGYCQDSQEGGHDGRPVGIFIGPLPTECRNPLAHPLGSGGLQRSIQYVVMKRALRAP